MKRYLSVVGACILGVTVLPAFVIFVISFGAAAGSVLGPLGALAGLIASIVFVIVPVYDWLGRSTSKEVI